MPLKFWPIAFFLLLSTGCSHGSASSSPASPTPDWTQDLAFKPGTSLGNPLRQKITLLNVADFRFVNGKAWLSGPGFVSLDDGHTGISVGGMKVEITFTNLSEPEFQECSELIKSKLAKDQRLVITGIGQHEELNLGSTTVRVVVLKLDHLLSCT